MSWWQFWKRNPVDNLDGYSPPSPAAEDPWQRPEVLAAIQQHSPARFDSFRNELTGIGSWLQDKTFGGMQGGPVFDVNLLSGIDCENRWRGSDLGGRIIETIPDEMTREGFDLQIQLDEGDKKTDAFPDEPLAAPPIKSNPKPIDIDNTEIDMAEDVIAALDELGLEDILWEALSYERAFGGAAILIGADDGKDISQPLDENNIREIRHLTAFRGGWDGELIAWSYYSDPTKPNYGMPETYMLRNLGVPIARIPVPGQPGSTALPPQTNAYTVSSLLYWVHESRLLIFPGTAVSRRARNQMRGWGDSVFVRCDRVLSQYDQTWGGIANLMTDFSQGVLAISGLAQTLGANNKAGTATLTSRARNLQMSRSISRVLLIDKEEEFRRDTASLAGISDLLQQFALRLAAAADMPVDLLMGQTAAGGLNKGDTTVRFFYDRIAARQKKRLLPQLRKIIRLMMLAAKGPTDGQEPEKWNVNFRPLYQESSSEKAARYLQIAQADQIYLSNSVVSPEEVAATRFGSSEFNDGPIIIDLEGREAMAEQDEKDKQERAKQMQEAAKKPEQGGGEDKPASGGGHTVKVEIASK